MNNLSLHSNNETKQNKKFPWKFFFLLLLLIYLSVLFYVTLLAWNHGSSYGPLGPGGRNYNVVPLRSIYRIAFFSPDVIDPLMILGGNIVMFIPFGMICASIVKKKRKALWLIPCTATILSIFIEINQYIFTHRVANVDDVLLNSLGGFLGAWFILIMRWFIQKFRVQNIQKSDNI
ncbi:VanZ family protein [Salibacterium salarium]|uniref:VanZ family protein n=1 Tax=Salibacterium salarium TaxID=284579 RepID=A0A428N474_9BACI|nr:VanZ family protein [Salibacterium salarium]RSL33273.1 VanZ family protein [Salibacterium salarium]